MSVSRRAFLRSSTAAATTAAAAALAVSPALAGAALPSFPDLAGGGLAGPGNPAPGTARAARTPREALQLLIDGNRRFLADEPMPLPTDRRRRLAIAQAQSPFAAYISCSDSRVAPELLFGRGLGELFIIRNAGNTLDTVARGSVEFAVAELGVPLVVVMGHQRCGAVKAACEVVEKNRRFPGNIGRMIEPIVPAVLRARGEPGDFVENSVRANVRRTVEELRTASEPMLLDPQRTGKVMVVGAYYALDTGRVDFFDVPRAA